jgi:hypothetical protein
VSAPDSGDDASKDEDKAVGDATMRAALLSVLTVGLAITVVSAAFAGFRFAAGAAIGGALATANLAVFARLGDAFLGGKGKAAPWGVVAMLKLVFLFGGVWLILKSELVSGISLAIGYAALPVGITLGSLFGPRPPEGPPEPADPADLAGDRPKGTGNGSPSAKSPGSVIKGKPRSPRGSSPDSSGER